MMQGVVGVRNTFEGAQVSFFVSAAIKHWELHQGDSIKITLSYEYSSFLSVPQIAKLSLLLRSFAKRWSFMKASQHAREHSSILWVRTKMLTCHRQKTCDMMYLDLWTMQMFRMFVLVSLYINGSDSFTASILIRTMFPRISSTVDATPWIIEKMRDVEGKCVTMAFARYRIRKEQSTCGEW